MSKFHAVSSSTAASMILTPQNLRAWVSEEQVTAFQRQQSKSLVLAPITEGARRIFVQPKTLLTFQGGKFEIEMAE